MVVFKSSEGAAVNVSLTETRVLVGKEDVRDHSLPDLSMYPHMTVLRIAGDCDLHNLHSLNRLDPSVVRLTEFESWRDSFASIDELERFPLTKVRVKNWAHHVGMQIPQFQSTLRDLTLAHMGLTNIEKLSMCTNLEDLHIPNNNITDLSPLSEVTTLIYVNLDGNPVIDLTPLLGSSLRLRKLFITRTHVADLSPLSRCNELRELSCDKTNVRDLSPLASCASLERLDASNNELVVTTMNPSLHSLVGLISLDVGSCGLTDISFIEHMPRLVNLRAADNNIQTLPDFTKVLGRLKVDLRDNPLNTKDSLVLQRLGALVAKGGIVEIVRGALDKQKNFEAIEEVLNANNLEASDDLAARVAAFCKRE